MIWILALAAIMQATVQYSLDTAFANMVFGQLRKENATRTAVIIVIIGILAIFGWGYTAVMLIGIVSKKLFAKAALYTIMGFVLIGVYAVVKIRKAIIQHDIGPEWWRYQLATSETIFRWIWVVITAALGAVLAGSVGGFYGSTAVLIGGAMNDFIGGLSRPRWLAKKLASRYPGTVMPITTSEAKQLKASKKTKYSLFAKILEVWGHRDGWIEEYEEYMKSDVIQAYWRKAKVQAEKERNREAAGVKFTEYDILERAAVIYETEYKMKAEAEQAERKLKRDQFMLHQREATT